jgi:hypothetical protein
MSITTKLICVALAAIIGFITLLYFTLWSSTEDVSDQEPYKNYVGKNLNLKQDAILVQNLPEFSEFSSNLLTEKTVRLYDGTSILYKLPKGTTIKINYFKSVKNGTSGFSTAYAVGTVYIEEIKAELDFEYAWGETTLTLDGIKWVFATPLW